MIKFADDNMVVYKAMLEGKDKIMFEGKDEIYDDQIC